MDASEEQPQPPEQSANAAAPIETWKSLPGQPGIEVFHLSPPPVPDVYDPELPIRRRVWLPLALFLITCVMTFSAGVVGWNGSLFNLEEISFHWHDHWITGCQYMLGVLGILLAHEMGHFLMAHRHRVPASFPYFIPFPMLLTGTMGAVIRMQGGRADRKQIFDIGIAGPLAGLVIAIPLLCYGIVNAEAVPTASTGYTLGHPLLVKFLIPLLRPDISANTQFRNPFWMAAWVGMLITGLNMMPVSQLDGGHVVYGLFGRHAKLVSRAFLLSALAYMVIAENYSWSAMVILVTFLGVDHPPTANEHVPLGPVRTVLGLLSLAIPVLCFMPTPISQ